MRSKAAASRSRPCSSVSPWPSSRANRLCIDGDRRMSATMSRVTDDFGIDSGYFDTAGRWWDTAPETRRALRAARGVDSEAPVAPPIAPVEVLRPGVRSRQRGPGELLLEDGTTLDVGDELPADLPFG